MSRNKVSPKAFIIRTKPEEKEQFARDFLNSADFTLDELKAISRDLGHNSGLNVSKNLLAQQISYLCPRSERGRKIVVDHLIKRSKKWVAIYHSNKLSIPIGESPDLLVVEPGERKWYGPVEITSDTGAKWFLRPEFVAHWEQTIDDASENTESESAVKIPIRWLCFARIAPPYITLHWNNFSHSADVQSVNKRNSQFSYWEFIPAFVNELQALIGTRLEPAELHRLVLHNLWSKFRYDKDRYEWEDIRIRAESGGVALNARSARLQAVELDFKGIHRFANTLRRAVETELKLLDMTLPNPEHFDEVILQTVIQDYGALSYEFCLTTQQGNVLYHGHSYFGGKPGQFSPDAFPHINLFAGDRDGMEQVQFLIDHLKNFNANSSGESGQLFLLPE